MNDFIFDPFDSYDLQVLPAYYGALPLDAPVRGPSLSPFPKEPAQLDVLNFLKPLHGKSAIREAHEKLLQVGAISQPWLVQPSSKVCLDVQRQWLFARRSLGCRHTRFERRFPIQTQPLDVKQLRRWLHHAANVWHLSLPRRPSTMGSASSRSRNTIHATRYWRIRHPGWQPETLRRRQEGQGTIQRTCGEYSQTDLDTWEAEVDS